MSDEELEEKIRDLVNSSGKNSQEIADVLGTLHDEFQMIADDEAAQ